MSYLATDGRKPAAIFLDVRGIPVPRAQTATGQAMLLRLARHGAYLLALRTGITLSVGYTYGQTAMSTANGHIFLPLDTILKMSDAEALDYMFGVGAGHEGGHLALSGHYLDEHEVRGAKLGKLADALGVEGWHYIQNLVLDVIVNESLPRVSLLLASCLQAYEARIDVALAAAVPGDVQAAATRRPAVWCAVNGVWFFPEVALALNGAPSWVVGIADCRLALNRAIAGVPAVLNSLRPLAAPYTRQLAVLVQAALAACVPPPASPAARGGQGEPKSLPSAEADAETKAKADTEADADAAGAAAAEWDARAEHTRKSVSHTVVLGYGERAQARWIDASLQTEHNAGYGPDPLATPPTQSYEPRDVQQITVSSGHGSGRERGVTVFTFAADAALRGYEYLGTQLAEETAAAATYLSDELRTLRMDRSGWGGGYLTGTLDDRALADLPAGAVNVFAQRDERKAPRLLIGLLLDASGSMLRDGGLERSSAYGALRAASVLVQAAALTPGVTCEVAAFSTTSDVYLGVLDRDGVAPPVRALPALYSRHNGGTPEGEAVLAFAAHLQAVAATTGDTAICLITVCDGSPDDVAFLAEAVDAVREAGIVCICLSSGTGGSAEHQAIYTEDCVPVAITSPDLPGLSTALAEVLRRKVAENWSV